ncbi:MAG TPA: hypothetical protein VGB55_13720, partial [Tepidisphaeraceae bacterium]
MVRSGLIKVVACAALWASFAMGDAVTLEMPLYAEVFVKSAAARNPKITGNLVRYDDAQITLKTGREEQSFQWAELTPSSAFTLRQRLIDKTKPDDWLNLGAFGWKLGAKDQAHAALRTAVSMDAALKQEAADITSQPAGPIDLPKPATDEPKADEKPAEKEDGELINTGKDATVAQPGRKKGEKAPRIQYQPATPEQHAEAIQ